ncbi:DUF4240 domain-containing protein [Salinispora fenicalii]|uniref:DUF4240 domain-containing protein n=1 Tax=Salinispora fenicalii TaxID=1137263 RepID=UPI000480EF45|nr:DUF4240 domain-containing protein [Salinispora fenicalii]
MPCHGLVLDWGTFWDIVGRARVEAGRDTERVAQVLLRQLRELSPGEIEEFQEHLLRWGLSACALGSACPTRGAGTTRY